MQENKTNQRLISSDNFSLSVLEANCGVERFLASGRNMPKEFEKDK